jgi:hypothetical protein
LACFRTEMPGSASFHREKKSWYAAFTLAVRTLLRESSCVLPRGISGALHRCPPARC